MPEYGFKKPAHLRAVVPTPMPLCSECGAMLMGLFFSLKASRAVLRHPDEPAPQGLLKPAPGCPYAGRAFVLEADIRYLREASPEELAGQGADGPCADTP